MQTTNHKKITGTHLKEEQVSGIKEPPLTEEARAKLLAEILAYK